MKGDFTRDTFDKSKNFSRVLWQQGRVQLDADFNEQTAILLHRQQALAADLIGPHGTPPANADEPDGFRITSVSATDFKIGNGRYYVDGILCENDRRDEAGNYVEVSYKTQPDYSQDKNANLPGFPLLVYLDVWERHLTYVELEDRDGSAVSIRESALKGPDTATRAKVVWQVKIADKLPDGESIPPGTTCEDIEKNHWSNWVNKWQRKNRGRLKATAVQTQSPDSENPCITPPEARYRGAENQLYRVEIHKPGAAGTATFKWSRDNGTVIFPVLQVAEKVVTLEHLERDGRFGLQVNDWVEIVDDDYTLNNKAEPLLQVTLIDPDTNQVTLDRAPTAGADAAKHRLLRRWDRQEPRQAVGAVLIKEGPTDQDWIKLENGIQIQFQPAKEGDPQHEYRTGDYWLIPARTATGDVEWPGTVGDPEALPPHGVEHHYAPLCIVPVLDDDNQLLDCRNKISRGGAADITPAQIGALSVGDYFGKTAAASVYFDQRNSNGAYHEIRIGFQPRLVLATGVCNAFLTSGYYGGTVSSFARIRDNVVAGGCSGIVVHKRSDIDWNLQGQVSAELSYASFIEGSAPPYKGELLKVEITALSSQGFTVSLTRASHGTPLTAFWIFLHFYCLG